MEAAVIHWNINPEIFHIGGFSLRYYGILFIGGILLCASILKRLYNREHIPLTNVDTLMFYGLIGIFVGARLGHCLFYDAAYYFSHPLEMLFPIEKTASGGYRFVGYLGLASHGGAIGLIMALILYARKTKSSIINTLDLIAIVAPLGGCLIRLGNLMNSEIIGIPATVPWAFVFERVDPVPRHPAQLYEALVYLSIFIVNLFLYNRYRPTLQRGFFFGFTIILIFIARFIIEFVKERQMAFEDQLTLDMGQLLSIPFILVGISFVVYSVKQQKQKPENNSSPVA